jgi:hypothetical protein
MSFGPYEFWEILAMNKLHEYQKTALAPLEKALKKAVADAEPEAAIEAAGRIQVGFPRFPGRFA